MFKFIVLSTGDAVNLSLKEMDQLIHYFMVLKLQNFLSYFLKPIFRPSLRCCTVCDFFRINDSKYTKRCIRNDNNDSLA